MKGFEQFVEVFGNITVLTVAEIIIGVVFLYAAYRKLVGYLIRNHEAQEERDAQLKEALEGVRKYPEYRQQSIDIQHALQAEI